MTFLLSATIRSTGLQNIGLGALCTDVVRRQGKVLFIAIATPRSSLP